MLYRELGTSCVDPATHIYEKINFESQRPLGFAGHPAIETRCITAVGSFKFEFSKILLAESICLKLSFRLHVVAWQPDNGKYVRLAVSNLNFSSTHQASGGSNLTRTVYGQLGPLANIGSS